MAEAGFRPGTVRFGWYGERFCYLADLTDDLPLTSAAGRNEPLWQMGDVLELFAGVQGHSSYIEYHTAPNGCILQLLWPDTPEILSSTSPLSRPSYHRREEWRKVCFE